MEQATEHGDLEDLVALNEAYHRTIHRISGCTYLERRLDDMREFSGDLVPHPRRAAGGARKGTLGLRGEGQQQRRRVERSPPAGVVLIVCVR